MYTNKIQMHRLRPHINLKRSRCSGAIGLVMFNRRALGFRLKWPPSPQQRRILHQMEARGMKPSDVPKLRFVLICWPKKQVSRVPKTRGRLDATPHLLFYFVDLHVLIYTFEMFMSWHVLSNRTTSNNFILSKSLINQLLIFFPQQRKLMGSSAQIAPVCAGAGRRSWFRRKVPEGFGGFRCVLV